MTTKRLRYQTVRDTLTHTVIVAGGSYGMWELWSRSATGAPKRHTAFPNRSTAELWAEALAAVLTTAEED